MAKLTFLWYDNFGKKGLWRGMAWLPFQKLERRKKERKEGAKERKKVLGKSKADSSNLIEKEGDTDIEKKKERKKERKKEKKR